MRWGPGAAGGGDESGKNGFANASRARRRRTVATGQHWQERRCAHGCLSYCLTYIATSPDRVVCSRRAWGAGPAGPIRPFSTGTSHEAWQDSIVRPGRRARRIAARGAASAAGCRDRPTRGNRGDRATARRAHRGRACLDHRLHGLRDQERRHPAPAGLHRADDGRVASADGGSRRHAGQHPRHQHRPRCGNEFRARHRRRAADQSAGAEPGAFRRHPDRSPEGPAGRALRPQRRRRRADPDHAQAGRGV